MGEAAVTFSPPRTAPDVRFEAGVALHGHTYHSEECLSFLPTYLRNVPGLPAVLRGLEPSQVDFSRAFWTPPLTPASALRLEQEQIAGLGLRPMVSLTDHDNIEAALALRVTAEVPISVEWTVPYARSIFHFGIHNLAPADAQRWIGVLSAYTASPEEPRLPGLLEALAASPDVLVVLNHPYFLEEGVRETDHAPALAWLLAACAPWIHALELNGTRPWKENAAAIEVARAHGRPVISGGDRHACEPAACINLTNARGFAEFVREVRAGESHVHFLPHYREPLALRILHSIWDVLKAYPEYPGRERWTDRVFYRGADDVARSLTELWGGRVPWYCTAVTAALQVAALRTMRPALRLLLSRKVEQLP